MNEQTLRMLAERSFLTAAGTETYLLFEQEFPMREFCAFEIFENEEALAKMENDYLFPIMSSVAEHGHGMWVDVMVWRAHPDYIAALGYAPEEIGRINRNAVARTRAAVDRWRAQGGFDAERFPVLLAADLGPRGDGYQRVDADLTVDDARDYHRTQLETLAETGVDILTPWTLTSATEAIGIIEAAREMLDVPVVISATVETDGRLPDGTPLGDFIARVDDETGGRASYFAVNCAHPTHLRPTLEAAHERGEAWAERLRGFRANSSTRSHEELDDSPELDRGNPEELASQLVEMRDAFGLKLLGGCCGTDREHLQALARRSAIQR